MDAPARTKPDETVVKEVGAAAVRAQAHGVLRRAVRTAAALLVTTGVTWAALFLAHVFDRRVPVLEVHAIGCLAIAVLTSATWLRWAILGPSSDA